MAESLVGVAYDDEATESVAYTDVMAVIFSLHLAIILGWFANQALAEAGYKLPLFVTCLLSDIVLSNTVPSTGANCLAGAK